MSVTGVKDIHLYLCLSSPNLRFRLKPPDILALSFSFSAVDGLNLSLNAAELVVMGDLLLSASFSLDESSLGALVKKRNCIDKAKIKAFI